MTDLDSPITRIEGAVRQNPLWSRAGLAERTFGQLFTGLVYAQIWEDPVVDMAAMRLGAEDRVVCIASGGCNLMSYLTASPRSIDAVDLSPAHVALTRLKLAGAERLPNHGAFHDFFGHGNRRHNPAVFDAQLAPHLDPATVAYWTGRMGIAGRRIDIFAKGHLKYGVLGRFIAAAHLVSRAYGIDYRPYLASRDLADQTAFFEARIAPLFERPLVRRLARRPASLFGLGIPPAQFQKLAEDGGGDIVPVLRARLRKLLCGFPLSENYFAWAATNRGYKPDGTGPLPPYLQARHWEALREAAPRATIVNRGMTEFLADLPAGSRTAYVLLDAQDWMSDAQLGALWAQITRTATPGARVVFRTGGTADILPGRLPPALLSRWRTDPARNAAFLARDRSAIYGGFHLYTLAAPQ